MVTQALQNYVSDWDVDALQKYDVAGPRYTSYPTANQFSSSFTAAEYCTAALQQQTSIAPISLYVHVPFCENICYYCACNKIVTRKRNVVRPFLDKLAQEASIRGKLHRGRPVSQLHLGGGTPTFLDPAELTELMYLLGTHFKLTSSDSREYSIEIDPRSVNKSGIALLKGLGFNRISMGIQDFDPAVQQAVNRIQPFSMVQELTDTIRDHGFNSLSFDLIYGLPQQTVASFAATLDQVIALNPDRIACYNYAHLPHRFSSQRSIDRMELPQHEQKMAILQFAGDRLLAAGYEYIGMDHFVRPTDGLATARSEGRLQRNFQGYSTCHASDLIGLGPSAISQCADTYSQNAHALEDYYALLQNNQLPIVSGLKRSAEDQLRYHIIMTLACQLSLDYAAIEARFAIVFKQHFSQALQQLRQYAGDGLVELKEDSLRVTTRGRLLLRNICMVFDAYLAEDLHDLRFSRTI